MSEFILEEQFENVINKNTKEYLKEVISSYNNGNYRAAIVVLYTAVIYDLMQKMYVLKEIYNDKNAKKILDDIIKQQKSKSMDSQWENNFIERIFNDTQIITIVEKEELLHLKKERNYAAHPIISIINENKNDKDDDKDDNQNYEFTKLELKQITRETAIDLIRKAFEIVFLRDVILAKNIAMDIVSDLNEYYKRVKTEGLEEFLNLKYFRRMTQDRKDYLLKILWKFIFIIDSDNECIEKRESNYWGLIYLYNENKYHYRNLIKKDEDYYFNSLEIETLKSWNKKRYENESINYSILVSFNNRSRIVFLIKFLEQAPEIYNILNQYAKNILLQSINHMYIEDKVLEITFYNCSYQNNDLKNDLYKAQVKLKSETIFLAKDIAQHFNEIFKMINNYQLTRSNENWIENNNYDILDEGSFEVLYHQAEYRGFTKELTRFLIEYCTGAQQYYQVPYLFNLLIKFKHYFKKEDYLIILTKINNNFQYYNNKEKSTILKGLEKIFKESYGAELVKDEEEKYLYNKLYDFNRNSNKNILRILGLIEERAMYYSIWDLNQLLNLINSNQHLLKNQDASLYPNILRVLNNKNDADYDESYLKIFNDNFDSTRDL